MPLYNAGKGNATMKVAILLCTLHGQQFLAELLQSIATQTYADWVVFASDDGSTDNTLEILRMHQAAWGPGKLFIHDGPAKGFSANFLSLLCNPNIQASCYAFADQDDLWEPDKLERAIEWLQAAPTGVAALYGSRTQLVDANNQFIGLSPLFQRPPCFSHALIQNIAGGNTMVFNQVARALVCNAGDCVDVVTHDWWLYLAVTGCGGRVFYDPKPSLRYRQHSGNAVGLDTDWRARLHRVQLLIQGRFKRWNDRNLHALERLRSQLTPENQRTLDLFKTARTRWLAPRVWGFWRAGIHRQSELSNIGLFLAAVFNRI